MHKVTQLLLLAIMAIVIANLAVTMQFDPLRAFAASGPQYKILASPGRDMLIQQYEDAINKMARDGWEFDNWVFRGSSQTPDLPFKKK